MTGLPPIGGDEPLVRDYLLHFLKDAGELRAYAPYIAESWLKAVFAEAKIVNGIGDPERWASLLSPAAFQALKDRVDVEFDPAHRAARETTASRRRMPCSSASTTRCSCGCTSRTCRS